VDLGLTPGQEIELFDPSTSRFSASYALSTPRGGLGAFAVSGGRALCAGGLGPDGLLGSAEIFTPGEVQP
jgi:hypothetical protein